MGTMDTRTDREKETMKTIEERRQEELARNVEYVEKDGRDYTIENGVVRWNSNGQVPPRDMLDAIATLEDIDLDACIAAREADNRAFFAEYANARKNMTEEQKAEEAYERRAAFGPGEEVVDVITGERYTT